MQADRCPDGAPGDFFQSAKHCLVQLAELGYALVPGLLSSEELEELRLVSGLQTKKKVFVCAPWRAAVAAICCCALGTAHGAHAALVCTTSVPQEADTLYELAEEEQQRGGDDAPAAAGSRVRWGREAAASCIYESIPGHACTLELRTCHAAYRVQRSRWPLRPGVWRLIFESRLTALVTALLGRQAVLFNDQVGQAAC